MEVSNPTKISRRNQFLKELLEQVSDPLHRRLVEAYTGDDPVKSMENELSKILREVLRHEDQAPDHSRV
jgi:hypothetical protein